MFKTLSLAIITCVSALTSPSQTPPGDKDLTLASFEWKKADANVTLELPFSSNTTFQKHIHEASQKLAHEAFDPTFYVPMSPGDPAFPQHMETLYKKAKDDSADIPLKAPLFSFDMKTTVLTQTPDLVSMHLKSTTYVKGAAHPFESGTYINFNPKTKEPIDLDFFTEDARARITQELDTQINHGLKADGYDQPRYAARALTPFGFKEGEIVFSFKPGSIAPSIYGWRKASIPYSQKDLKQQ